MTEPMRRYILTRVGARERMECRAYMKKQYARYIIYTAVYCLAMIVIGWLAEWDMEDLCWDLALVSFCIFGMLWSHWSLWRPPSQEEMNELGGELQ